MVGVTEQLGKFFKLAPVGTTSAVLRVPIGLSAAETTNTMGSKGERDHDEEEEVTPPRLLEVHE
jgi:hypothetical protein